MILIDPLLLDNYKKTFPHLSSAINRLVTIIEMSQWTTPQDVKSSFGRHVDYVAPFWIVDVDGKAGARVLLKIEFDKKIVVIKRIWINHKQYMRWSQQRRGGK